MDRKRKLEIFQPVGEANQDNGPPVEGTAEVNPYTGLPYSNRYFEILKGRKGANKRSFLEVLKGICGSCMHACHPFAASEL